jgi:hypothetical protein
VQPLVKQAHEDETGERVAELLPQIVNVPVVMPGSGGVRIKFPIAAGDVVLLVFASCSLDRWLSLGGEVDPEDPRRGALEDAIAIPGLQDFANVADASPLIEFTGSEIRAGGSAALALKSDLDDLKASLSAWVPVATDGGAALKTQLTTDGIIGPGWPVGTTTLKGA